MTNITVTTKEPLSRTEKLELEEKFRAEYRDEIKVDYHIDPVLVGNIVVFDGKKHTPVIKLTVTTSVALTKEQKTKLEKAFSEKYSQKIYVEYVVDDAIIGGIIVFDGKQVFDNSVRGKLNAIREKLENGKA